MDDSLAVNSLAVNNVFLLFSMKSIFAYFFIYLVDTTIKRANYNGRWFQLHATINYVISLLTYNDVIDCMYNPTVSRVSLNIHNAGYLALILHIYHCVFFTIRKEDWIHHISSVFIVSPICICFPTKGMSLFYFFLTGLPGAIDYTMLSFQKNNIISKNYQKKINAHLNIYIRQPGGIICSYLIFKDSIASTINIYTLFLSFVVYFNASFYCKQAVENYGKNCIL